MTEGRVIVCLTQALACRHGVSVADVETELGLVRGLLDTASDEDVIQYLCGRISARKSLQGSVGHPRRVAEEKPV